MEKALLVKGRFTSGLNTAEKHELHENLGRKRPQRGYQRIVLSGRAHGQAQGAGAGGEEQRMLAAAAARKKALLARDGEAVLQRERCWWAVVGP